MAPGSVSLAGVQLDPFLDGVESSAAQYGHDYIGTYFDHISDMPCSRGAQSWSWTSTTLESSGQLQHTWL